MNACVTEQITVNGAKRLVMLMYTGILRQEKKYCVIYVLI